MTTGHSVNPWPRSIQPGIMKPSAPEEPATEIEDPSKPHHAAGLNLVIKRINRGTDPMVTRELTELGQEECRRLLSSHHFGRLAFLDRVGVQPMITPVNYGFVDDAVVIRS